MKQMRKLFLLILCAGFFGLQINAQIAPVKSKNDDARVEAALKEAGIKYDRDEDGNYEVTFKTTGNRMQTAFIVPRADKFNDSEVRLLFSIAMISRQPLSLDVANLLLEQNMEKVSYWTAFKTRDGKTTVANLIYIPADADGEKLNTALSIVTSAADKMEERLTKKDEL